MQRDFAVNFPGVLEKQRAENIALVAKKRSADDADEEEDVAQRKKARQQCPEFPLWNQFPDTFIKKRALYSKIREVSTTELEFYARMLQEGEHLTESPTIELCREMREHMMKTGSPPERYYKY